MSKRPPQARTWSEALSDLADGRGTPEQAQTLSAAWKDDAELRRDWQVMHLIGDSLRSAELAQQAQPSADLLAGLRTRIAHEPVPLRPRGRWNWLAPFAVAAGFVLLALAVPDLQTMLLRPTGDPLAFQSQAAGRQGPVVGTTLTGGQPSFEQSMTDPAVRAVSLLPAGGADAVAPFELSAPAANAASVAMTSASSAR